MNPLIGYEKRFKYNFLKKIIIKSPTIEDIDRIVNLIKEEYGEDYLERHCYNRSIIKKLIYKTNKGKNIIWKCAFHNDNLIGQVVFEITNSIGFIKLTIINKNFRHLKILSLLGINLAKEIKKFPGTEIKYIYAVVDKDNTHVINLISKYKFFKLANTPMWDKNRNFIIFGRKSFNLKEEWRQINVDFDLFKNIFNLKQRLNLKIHLQAHSLSNQIIEKYQPISLKIRKNKGTHCTKIFIIFSKNEKNEELCAEITENTFLKSWYDFRLKNKFSSTIKIQVLNFVIELFENSREINSLSLIIDAKDYEIQNFLLKSGIKCFGFLPYYLDGKDAILMGKSKIAQVFHNG